MFDAAIAAVAEATPHAPEIVPVVPGLVVHIDGDYLAYHASGNDDTTQGEARLNAVNRIQSFMSRIGAEHAVVHNTAKGCQKGERYLIATVKPYQGQRSSDRRPKNHAYLQGYLQGYEGDLFRAKNWSTREADDGIGACAHYAIGKGPGYIGIATADKDLRMLPGVHICWAKPNIVTRVMPGDFDVRGEDGKQYGLKFFFIQMLMGDQADHIPGLEQMRSTNAKGQPCFKKVGEVTATSLIDDCANVQEATRQVMDLYRLGYAETPDCNWADRFVEQAALLWMRLGNDAGVTDFAHHSGFSRINHAFSPEVWEAVARLETRVQLAREQINALSRIDDPPTADCLSTG